MALSGVKRTLSFSGKSRKKAKSAPKKHISKNMKLAVSKVLLNQMETKANLFVLGHDQKIMMTGLNDGATVAPLPAAPARGYIITNPWASMDIITGSFPWQRQGAEVMNPKLTLSWTITAAEYDPQNNNQHSDFEVHVLAWKTKGGGVSSNPSGRIIKIPQTAIAANDNAGPIDPGTDLQGISPFNKDEYVIIFHKVYKFSQQSPGLSAFNPNTVYSPALLGSGNVRYVRGSAQIPLPKKLEWTDAGWASANPPAYAKQPVNHGFAMGAYVINNDGAVDINATNPQLFRAKMSVQASMTWKDA